MRRLLNFGRVVHKNLLTNKILRCLLCLAFCSVMLGGILPTITVSAAETEIITEDVRFAEEVSEGIYTYMDRTVTTTRELPEDPMTFEQLNPANQVSILSVEAGDNNDYYFTTFEDLKGLAAGTYSDYSCAYYQGTESLVITEDLTLPENLNLSAWENQITIPAGVTLTTSANISAGTIVIEGTVSCYNLRADKMTVNGTLYTDGGIILYTIDALTGGENIVYNNSWAGINYSCTAADIADLKKVISIATESTDSRESYWLGVSGSILLNESLSIPANCDVTFYEAVTVASGSTLTNDSRLVLFSSMTVEGTLYNNDQISIYYDNGGILTIADGGSYTGGGDLYVYGSTLDDPAVAVPGLNLSNYDCTEINNYMHYWQLSLVIGLTKLGNPTDLEWGYDHDWYGSLTERPGMISWKTAQPDQGEVRVCVYREGQTGAYATYYWGFRGEALNEEWHSIPSFWEDEPESGTYYFTVTSIGDYTTYYNSDTITSDTWTYIKPSAKVSSCTDLSWNWPRINYKAPADMTNVGGYEVEFYFAESEEESPVSLGSGTSTTYINNIYSLELGDSIIQHYGDGLYYFRVRALSGDITAACHGEWSELSPAYNVNSLVQGVKSELEGVVADKENLTDEEIREAVQNVDTDDLKTAMLADQEGTGVIADIATLEEAVGGSAVVEVVNEVGNFEANKISVVGANLNNAAFAENPIKLVIDKPKEEHVLEALYDSSVAVKFSMDLVNVEDSENLAVPVKITLPIPADINPRAVVIFHYHVDGTREELVDAYIYSEGGQYYASFVLTSFSDFVMTQYAPEDDETVETTPMYRLYNPNSGEHFYTGSIEEKDVLVAAGWQYEGIAWNAPISTGEPVYRMFNPNNGDHHYTMSQDEVDMLVEYGWQYEGVCWNSASSDNLPLYRLYNPNADCGSHHYTGSEEERDNLTSLGWIYEGIGWYGMLQ